MLDYIKSQVRARNAQAVQEQPSPENVPNDVITGYAHLFQEMELSEEGTDAGKLRKMAVDIPLEEDPEIETVELSMDGRVVDVPGDAAAPTEEITESYKTMKTYDQFYQEALVQVPRLMRESDDHYNARVTEVADAMYQEYCVDAEKIGDFGFTKINITDEKVPSKMLVDFGVIQEGATNTFMSKLNIFYATDEDHNIIKKQLDSVRLVKDGAFQNIGSSLKAYMESTYDVSADTNIWDVCTPKSLIVPKGNGDSFCVVLEYANEVTGKNEYFGWTRPVVFQEGLFKKNTDGKKTLDADEAKKLIKMNIKNSNCGAVFQKPTTTVDLVEDSGEIIITSPTGSKVTSKGFSFKDENGKTKTVRKAKIGKKWVVESVDIEGMETVNMESFVNETHYENRDRVIQESLNEAEREISETRKRPLSRFYQEAIDFGGGDGGSDLPPAQDGGDTAPAADAGTADASGDANAAPAEGEDDKKVAAVNDVSADIAKKVQEDTQNDANNTTITFPDENPPADAGASDAAPSVDTSTDASTESGSDDIGATDTSSLDDVAADSGDAGSTDDSIDGIDNTAVDDTSDDFATSEDMGSDEEGLEDGDMDVDLSNMTIDEIMDQANEKIKGMTLDEIKNFIADASPSEIQEAFILTKKNINKEVDVRLRETLGILNDNKMNIDSLVKKFKHAGHRLNRVLSKATKMSGVYSSDEVGEIKKLNNILGQLIISLKKKDDSAAVPNIKRQITEFTNQSKIVGAFVEDKLNAKPVQEGYVQEGLFLSSSNAKKRLGRKLAPVQSDLSNIISAGENGTFTKGKLNKMYKPSKRTWGFADQNTGLRTAKDYDVNTPQSENINDLQRILSKIIRKPKVQVVFDNNEIGMISDLNDCLDDFVDMVESVIYDNSSSDNKSVLDKIVELSKKILNLIDKLSASCEVVSDSIENKDTNTEEEPTTSNEEPDFDVDDVTGEEPSEPSEDNDTENGEEDDV